MKGYYFFFFLLGLYSSKTLAQPQKQELLTEQLTYNNYAVITIVHNAERYNRTEINLIYRFENRIKIHSIVKEPSASIDTLFLLSGGQIMLIDKFGKDVKEDKIVSNDIIIAGSRTDFEILLNGKQTKLVNKIDYSLLKELFQIK